MGNGRQHLCAAVRSGNLQLASFILDQIGTNQQLPMNDVFEVRVRWCILCVCVCVCVRVHVRVCACAVRPCLDCPLIPRCATNNTVCGWTRQRGHARVPSTRLCANQQPGRLRSGPQWEPRSRPAAPRPWLSPSRVLYTPHRTHRTHTHTHTHARPHTHTHTPTFCAVSVGRWFGG